MKYTFTIISLFIFLGLSFNSAKAQPFLDKKEKKAKIKERKKERKQKIKAKKKQYPKSKTKIKKLVSYDLFGGAFLGVESNTISKRKAQKLGFSNYYGSYITKVIPGTAADEAGLRPFDYLYGIDDLRTNSDRRLSSLLSRYDAGDRVELSIIRNGRKKTLRTRLGERGDGYDDDREEVFLGIGLLGDLPDDMSGVFVYVVDNSTAEELGIQRGDKITAINGYPVLDWTDITTAIDNMIVGETIRVDFTRNGQTITSTQSGSTRANERDGYITERNPNSNFKNWNENSNEIYNHNENHNNTGAEYDDEYYQQDKSAFIGINLGKMSPEKAKRMGFDNHYGTYVSSIVSGTAAEKYGILPLDYIYGVDEYRVGADQRLGSILKKYQAGDRAEIKLVRQQKRHSLPIVLGSRDDKQNSSSRQKSKCEDPFFGISSAYGKYAQGVPVNIVQNSTAKNLGMEHGDIITHINDYVMVDWDDIGGAIDLLAPGDPIKVNFIRDGRSKSLSGTVQSYAVSKNCKNCDCNDWDEHENIVLEQIEDVDESIDIFRDDLNLSEFSIEISDYNGNVDAFNARGTSNNNSNERLRINDIRISSNDDKGVFDMEFRLPTNGKTVVKVFNPDGRIIYEYDLGEFSGDFEDEVDMIQNGTGTYLLLVEQDGKNAKKKILIKK